MDEPYRILIVEDVPSDAELTEGTDGKKRKERWKS